MPTATLLDLTIDEEWCLRAHLVTAPGSVDESFTRPRLCAALRAVGLGDDDRTIESLENQALARRWPAHPSRHVSWSVIAQLQNQLESFVRA